MQPETQIPKSADVIKAAVRLAGGAEKVAAALCISEATVNGWAFRGSVPSQYIRRLCAMGGGVVSVVALLEANERTAQERAAA